jgi:hypothetical protein
MMARTKSGAGSCENNRWDRQPRLDEVVCNRGFFRRRLCQSRIFSQLPGDLADCRLSAGIPKIRPAAICWLWVCLAFGPAATTPLAAQDQPNQSNSAAENLNSEPDPSRRAERALSLAEGAFAEARVAYDKGQIKAGDQHLDEMIKLLNVCVSSLEAAHKSHNYKSAEIRVKGLMRRLKTLIGDLSVDDRGWAEYTARQLEEIHDKLLSGVMKK